MPRVNAAVIQTGSKLFDTAETLEKFQMQLTRAADDGAQIVVFPEAFIGGYPKGSHFGAPVGSRSKEGRDLYRRYFEGAIVVPGPETDRMAALAGECNADVIAGVVEKDGGTLYCTALVFSADGRLLGKRRKLVPTAAERIIWGMGDGSTLEAFDGASGKIGVAICWENYMPMLRMSQYGQGVQLYCAPTVDDRDSWTSLMRTIALEGRCFVLSACQYLPQADISSDFNPVEGVESGNALISGGSVIVSPLGEILAGPVFGEEATLTAALDLHDIARGKMDFDVAGHYARPDIFSLHIDRAAKRPVS